ncbi:MAG: universal stress protein [Bacteroidetes bacterium]|nr:universal stress protein [Bacteroidota bacterium]
MKTLKILVPVDFSEQSLSVIRYALSVNGKTGGPVTVLYVNEMTSLPFGSSSYPFGVVTFPELENEINDWARQEFLKLQDHLSAGEKKRTQLLILSGKASDVLVAKAAEDEYDLIVMATHSHGAMEKFFLGSTMERVIRISETPVLVLRDPSSVPAFPPEKILITTDYSPQSLAVAEEAADLLSLIASPVTLLAVESFEAGFLDGMTDVRKATINSRLTETGCRPEWVQIRSTDAVEGILDFIQSSKPGLVAMATHGRSGLSKILLGSTTESIIRQVKVPVLVIRTKS